MKYNPKMYSAYLKLRNIEVPDKIPDKNSCVEQQKLYAKKFEMSQKH